MSTLFIFGNNASTTNANAILSTDTTVVVQTGTGSLFPAPSAGQQLSITVEDVSGNLEVMYCTGISADTLTVTRAQEGTTARGFASGSRVEARLTKGMLQALLQKNGGDTLTGTTNLSGVLSLASAGSIQGGEFTGAHRGAPGQTANQILVPVGSGPATQAGSPILTTANITGNLPSGFDFVHTNMVCMWNGLSSAVPSGWHICDGTNGTPNLENNFVVGAGGTYALGATGGSATTVTGSTDPSSQISVAGHALTLAELAVHNHTMWTGGYAGATGSGIVTLLTGGTQQNVFPAGEAGITGNQIIGNAGSGNAHTHTLSGNLAHTHSYTLPPYYALFYIMKL